MVRKIGFGKDGENKEPSVAERHVEKFRARARQKSVRESRGKRAKPPLAARIPIIIFLVVWLVFWTAGIIGVAVAIAKGDGGDIGFLVIWEALAFLGWVAVVYVLIRTIRGRTPRNDGKP